MKNKEGQKGKMNKVREQGQGQEREQASRARASSCIR